MKLGFSRPTQENAEQQTLFTSFASYGYAGLQLKYPQYKEYIRNPARFVDEWGAHASHIASGLIFGAKLDDVGIAELRSLFLFGQYVGSERIVFCHSEPREGLSTRDIQEFARTLSELGKEAQQHGVTLSLHHHYNQPVMHRQDFAVFFDVADAQYVKLTIDTAHLVKSGVLDIADVIRDYRQVIDNIHAKDFAQNEFQILGRGDIHFVPIFAALHEIGYEGWLCADEESGGGLVDGMQSCAQYLIAHWK